MNRGVQLACEAVGKFDAAVFWPLPQGFAPRTLEQAHMIAGILRKHGGRAGWEAGRKIDDAIDRTPTAGASPACS
jgi:hypothetical protein